MAPALQRTRVCGKQVPVDPRIKPDGHCIKKIYLVTIPQMRITIRRRLRAETSMEHAPLRSPAGFSRQQIEEILLDAASHSVYEDNRNHHHHHGVVL